MPILRTEALTRCFGALKAVDALSVAVEPGEVFGLLGPNGAGKTTVIKMLTTLLPPTSGKASVGGFDVVRQAGRVRRLIGYVPQMLSADGTLTGYENLLIFAKLYDLPRAERRHYLNRQVFFWAAVITGSFFMATSWSRPIWDALPPLQYLSFPTRFLHAAVPGAVFLATLWNPHFKTRYVFVTLSAIYLAIAALCACSLFGPDISPVEETLAGKYLPFSEYRTHWQIASGRSEPQIAMAHSSAIEITEGEGSASLRTNSERQMTLHAEIISSQASLLIRRFYFPGWQSPMAEISVKPAADGLMSLSLPKGSHDVVLSMPYYKGEREGLLISITALLLAFTARVWHLKLSRKPPIAGVL